jgi:hypothetical protein
MKDYLLTDSSLGPARLRVRRSTGLLGKGLPSLAYGSIPECRSAEHRLGERWPKRGLHRAE